VAAELRTAGWQGAEAPAGVVVVVVPLRPEAAEALQGVVAAVQRLGQEPEAATREPTAAWGVSAEDQAARPGRRRPWVR
jgi:hypothetical protein